MGMTTHSDGEEHCRREVRIGRLMWRMLMKHFPGALAALVLATGAAIAVSASEPTIHVETLVKSTQSWNGVPYTVYGKVQPELTVLKMEIPAHSTLPWHSHTVPNAAYVVSGHLNVEDRASGRRLRVDAGQAFTEQVGAIHRGFTDDEPAIVVVTYAGYPGAPLSIHADDP